MTKLKKSLNFYDLLEEKYSDFIRTKEYDDKDKVVDVISTGSPSLDISIGVGGIPMRRATEIYGLESVGKSTLCLSIAGNAVRSGKKVLYVDIEQAVDYTYGELIIGKDIFDENKFMLVQPDILEHGLELCEAGIQSGDFGLVILDSIGSLVPKKVKDETLDDSNPYILAKKMTLFTQRNLYDIRHFDVAFVAANQVRDDTSNPYLRGMVKPPGGHAWHHGVSLQIKLSNGGLIKAGNETIGLNSKFLITKNKVSPPFKSYSFPIIFGVGIDYYRDITDYAITLGVIKRYGSYYKFNEELLGRGVADVADKLRDDKDALDNIIEVCYNIAKIGNKALMIEESQLEEGDFDEEVG